MQGLLPAVSPCCWLANLTQKMITVCMAPHGANVCTCMNSRGKGDEKGAHCQCRSRPEKAWSSMRQMLPHSATIIKIVVRRFNAQQRILLRDCCQNWLRQPPGPSPRARGIASKACMSRRTGRLFGSGRVCHACTCRRSCAMGAVGSHVCSSKGASGVKAGRDTPGKHFFNVKADPCQRRLATLYGHAAKGKGMEGQHGIKLRPCLVQRRGDMEWAV